MGQTWARHGPDMGHLLHQLAMVRPVERGNIECSEQDERPAVTRKSRGDDVGAAKFAKRRGLPLRRVPQDP
jgi:hypothetical protein